MSWLTLIGFGTGTSLLRHALQKNVPGWAPRNVLTRSTLVSTWVAEKREVATERSRKCRAVASSVCVAGIRKRVRPASTRRRPLVSGPAATADPAQAL